MTPFGRAMNREMSTSWRGQAGEAANFRQSVLDYLEDLTNQVKLIDKSETKLSGRSATIPVTVQNNLVQGVEHLVLRLTSTNPTRLKIGGKAYWEQQVTVNGGHSQSVKFTTSANANGKVGVIAQLYTEDGQEYGQAVNFDVKVTEVTATVMLVIGGGVLLLVLMRLPDVHAPQARRRPPGRGRGSRRTRRRGGRGNRRPGEPRRPPGPSHGGVRHSAPGRRPGAPE